MRARSVRRPVGAGLHIVFFLLISAAITQLVAQATPPSGERDAGATEQQLKQQIAELRELMLQLRSETEQYRTEVRQLQSQLEAAVAERHSTGAPAAGPSVADQTAAPSEPRVAALEDEISLLAGKVDDQYQSKVESGSRYRVKLSGIALFNAFSNRGSVDSIDVPQYAVAPAVSGGGSIGASFRQSQIGMQVFGPEWLGARVDGDLRFDFAGGFPTTTNGVTFGFPRLRTGTINLRWHDTIVTAGQDAPFFSALSPSSLASLAEPAFSYSGNLWYWIPQVRVEHRIKLSPASAAVIQAGLLDPLTGQTPPAQFDRSPQAGENSRSPAYAARLAWASGSDDAFSLGAAGYFSRESWGFERNVTGWAGTLDWQFPLGPRFSVRGEFYRGSAIGGLGGSGGYSVLSSGAIAYSNAAVQGLQTLGGWSQLKFRATSTVEFNGGYGQDNPFSSQLRALPVGQAHLYPYLGINRDFLLNSIYHARSNLLLSLEYRHLYSARLLDVPRTAEHVNAAIGVLF